MSSRASDFSSLSSPLPDWPFHSSNSNSWYHRQNPNPRNWTSSDEIKVLVPGDIFVNGKRLSSRELNLLLNCLNPPKKLKPGNYWYDRYSGFWGKRYALLARRRRYIPSKSSHHTPEALSMRDFDHTDIQKLFLIGCSGSGSSAIFKQAIFLYKDVPFVEDELEYIKLLIQSNIYRYIRILLQGHEHFQEENLSDSRTSQSANEHWLIGYNDANDEESMYSFGPRLKAFTDWLLHTMPLDGSNVFSASLIQASAPLVEELWRNTAFKDIQLLRSYSFNAVDLFKPDYKPSNTDILYVEGFPSSLSYTDFSFPPPNADEFAIWDLQDYMKRYQLMKSTLDIFGDNYKLFESEDTRFVIFSISLTDYDQFIIDDNGDSINKMMFNKDCFESTLTNLVFYGIQFLLLLTKYDLFEEKISGAPLNRCDWFNDLDPVLDGYVGRKEFTPWMGFQYVADKFKQIYGSLTGRKLYVAKVNCLECDSVDGVLKYARDIVKWNEDCNEFVYVDE